MNSVLRAGHWVRSVETQIVAAPGDRELVPGRERQVAPSRAAARDAFDDELLSLQVQTDGNLIVFGFKERRPDLHWERIEAGAADLKRQFHLDFPRYAQSIAADSKLREARMARGACAGLAAR